MVLFCQLRYAYRGFSHGCLKIQAAFAGNYHVCIRKFLLQSHSIQNQFDTRCQRRAQVGEKGEAKPSGSTGTSGEFGHMTIDKSGPLCDCGCYGCLEAIASANAISKQARFAISNGANSMMFDIIHGNLNDINAKVVFDAAKAGDSLANTIVNQVTVYLGIAISNVINLLDPQLIILGGGVSQAGDFLLNPLLDEVSRHVLPVKEPHIVISSLGEDAVAIGAATFLLKEYVESGKVQ